MANVTHCDGGKRLKELAKKFEKQAGFIKNNDWSIERLLTAFSSMLKSSGSHETITVANEVAEFIIEKDFNALFQSVDVKNWIDFTLILIEWSHPKQFKNKEDTEYDRKDYEIVQEKILMCLRILGALLEKLQFFAEPAHLLEKIDTGDNSDPYLDKRKLQEYVKTILQAVTVDAMLIAFTSFEETLWASCDSIESAIRVTDCLVELIGCYSLTNLLCGTTEHFECKMFPKGIYSQILSRIQPFLTKDRWKRNPVMKEVFKQSLLHVKMPELGDYIDKVFPIILILADDYMVSNKLIGLQCLDHVLRNTSSAELRWYGRADVLYDVLFQQLYSKESDVIEMVLPCLLAILKVAEVSPYDTDKPREYSRYDKVFIQIVTNMEMENQLVLRRTYTKFLPSFVESMGITVLRHNKRVLRLIDLYLEQYDGPVETARLNIIKTLSSYIQTTWPRIPEQSERILKSVLKFVYEISEDKTMTRQDVKESLLAEATNCLVVLKRASNKEVTELLTPMENDKFNAVFDKCVREILEAE